MTRPITQYSPFVAALADALEAADDGWAFDRLVIAWTHPTGLRAVYLSGKGVRIQGAGVASSGLRDPAAAAGAVAEQLIAMARRRAGS